MHNFYNCRARERRRREGLLATSREQEYMGRIMMLCTLFLKAGEMPGFWGRKKIWSMG